VFILKKKSSSPEPAGQFQCLLFVYLFIAARAMKLGINYAWVKGILLFSNKGPDALQRGGNHKNAKMGWGHLKHFFSRTSEPE
jgi:hypothetical protein